MPASPTSSLIIYYLLRILIAIFINKNNNCSNYFLLSAARSPAAYGLDEKMTAVKHGRLVLRCRTRGNPVPAVQWYKNGKRLPAAGTKRIRIKTKRCETFFFLLHNFKFDFD